MKITGKHSDVKLLTTEARRNYLVSEPSENLSAIKMRKKQVLISKPVYLGLSILELSKIVMYDFWYDSVKPKYGKNAKLCYMDTNTFIACIETDDIYKDITEDVKTRFGTSNYDLDRPFEKDLKGKIKK